MSECVHIGCDRPQRARRLCEAHYAKLKRSGLGPVQRKQPEKPTGLKAMAQAGLNRSCVDCRAVPFGGGMRCLPCFQLRVRHNAGDHQSVERPSYSTYKAGCRCRQCRRESADYTARRRAEAA